MKITGTKNWLGNEHLATLNYKHSVVQSSSSDKLIPYHQKPVCTFISFYRFLFLNSSYSSFAKN